MRAAGAPLSGDEVAGRIGRLDRISRWATGPKIFLILSIALLPLALIASLATVRLTQIATTERRAHLRVATAESSRAIGIELIGDMTALRTAVNALDADAADAPSCARVQGVFASQASAGAAFVVVDRAGHVVCGTPFASGVAFARHATRAIDAQLIRGRGVALRVAGDRDGIAAAAFFPASLLDQIGRPSAAAPDFGTRLILGDDELPLHLLARDSLFERRNSERAPLGIGDLVLEMQVRAAPISSPLLIALTFPVLMWIAAAVISWFVTDRLLIRPLRDLRASIAAFTPGEEPDPALLSALPAREIAELGDTFRALSRTVALHEAGLAEGLVRQTKLTREVHHRVKNNLQVISSLINFHARGAPSPDAAQAYASIQRRVDALAVVHRYHYAEMEENRGVGLRQVIVELASNIRATAAEGSRVGIALHVEPYYVTQDVAVAVCFLITELVELAMSCDPAAQISVSLRPTTDEQDTRAVLRLSSRALVDSDALRERLERRYGRVIEGLTRQLRSTLQHQPLEGAYEVVIAVTGRD